MAALKIRCGYRNVFCSQPLAIVIGQYRSAAEVENSLKYGYLWIGNWMWSQSFVFMGIYGYEL